MSRSSGSSPTTRRPTRAQVEPLAALVAVFAVGAALAAYTGVLDDTLPTTDRDIAEPTVDRAERAVGPAGVANPESLAAGLRAAPDGYAVNLTLSTAGRTWRTGPTPPARADAAELAVSVRVGPGRLRPGRLRAEVWT